MERLTERDDYGDVYVKQHDYITASKKLCEYEELEEQGLLLRLPCKVGDTIFALMEDKPKSIEETVCSKMCIEIQAPFPYDNGIKMFFKIEDFGKTVFLTKEEAERALREAKE